MDVSVIRVNEGWSRRESLSRRGNYRIARWRLATLRPVSCQIATWQTVSAASADGVLYSRVVECRLLSVPWLSGDDVHAARRRPGPATRGSRAHGGPRQPQVRRTHRSDGGRPGGQQGGCRHRPSPGQSYLLSVCVRLCLVMCDQYKAAPQIDNPVSPSVTALSVDSVLSTPHSSLIIPLSLSFSSIY